MIIVASYQEYREVCSACREEYKKYPGFDLKSHSFFNFPGCDVEKKKGQSLQFLKKLKYDRKGKNNIYCYFSMPCGVG